MGKTLDPQKVKQILELRKQGKTHAEIARIVGTTRNISRNYCLVYGIGEIKAPFRMKTEEEKNTIRDMYLNQGMTPSEIAAKTGIARSTVVDNLIRQGVYDSKKSKGKKGDFSKPMPPLKLDYDPIYYPERKITPKKVQINGKRYQDISEVYGL